MSDSSSPEHSEGSGDEHDDDLHVEYASDDEKHSPKQARRSKTAHKSARRSKCASAAEETKAPAPKQVEACGLDMRWTFPIDEDDETSAEVMATLSYFMQKMQRALTETELMSYIHTWLIVCHALNRVNPNEYESRYMRYSWQHLSSNCFRFEIIARLHEVCYATFHHCFDHVYDLAVNHGVSPIVLNPPVAHVVPIEHVKLCRMLRAQTEFCQIAVAMVHSRWTDFVDAWGTDRDANDVAYMSQAHTASLGVLCSHLLQILATLKRKPGDPGFDERMFTRCVWQSAAALSVAQETLPLPLMHIQRVSLRRVSAQLQILLYRGRAKKAETACAWGTAAYFTNKILDIVGQGAHGDNDRNALFSYNTLASLHAATIYDHKKDRGPVADLDEALAKMKPLLSGSAPAAASGSATTCTPTRRTGASAWTRRRRAAWASSRAPPAPGSARASGSA